jgi:hypothetical protein
MEVKKEMVNATSGGSHGATSIPAVWNSIRKNPHGPGGICTNFYTKMVYTPWHLFFFQKQGMVFGFAQMLVE